MKKHFSIGAYIPFFLILIFIIPHASSSSSPHHYKSIKLGKDSTLEHQRHKQHKVEMEVYPSGSTLPDCSHACGPCFPCKRVMVAFKCSIAESCPLVYKCLCNGKYYHVPSS